MPKGYAGQLLWVDLSTGKTSTTVLDEATAKQYLGGSGLGAKLIRDRLKTIRGPLDPSNPLCFMPGLLCGTLVPGSNRTTVCALSPATNAWGEARAGGAWAPMLKYAGYDGAIFVGKAAHPVYVWIENDRVEIRPADRAYRPSNITQAIRESFSPAWPMPATTASGWVSASRRVSVSKKPFPQSPSAGRISTRSFSIQT